MEGFSEPVSFLDTLNVRWQLGKIHVGVSPFCFDGEMLRVTQYKEWVTSAVVAFGSDGEGGLKTSTNPTNSPQLCEYSVPWL